MRMTSAYANKMIKKLQDDKDYWCEKEREECVYVATTEEEPVIPEYDFAAVAKEISEIDEKIVKIKHAINVFNATNKIAVGEEQMTIDAILIHMSQLNNRKIMLDYMRKQPAKKRLKEVVFGKNRTAPEYQYTNYDIEKIKEKYEKVTGKITEMQIALDRYNQTVEFEVDLS